MNRRIASLALLCAFFIPVLAMALDKEEKQWLDDVRSLLLPAEEKIFNALKSKEDRTEFQKIFWARRDPDLLTAENEFQKTFEERRAKAKADFTMKAMDRDAGIFLPVPGDQSDCGIVFIALGPPASTEKIEGEKKQVKDMPARWTYTGGISAQFVFDGNCRFPVNGADAARDQVKSARVLQSDVSYFVEKGKLTKPLADMLPKPGPAQALLLQPRTDFEIAQQASFVKIHEGGTGVFGLLKGDAAGLTVEDVGGAKKAKILVRAEAKGPGATVLNEREVLADVDAENKFLASYRLGLRPGAYELKVGAVDPVSNKGSVVQQTLEVPDFNKGEVTISSLFALADIQDVTPDPKHAFSAFEIGTTRMIPRFGNVFKQSDNLQISYQFYDPKVDEATKKSATVARLSILKASGGVAAEAPEQEFDTPVAGSAIGPVSLAKYLPGKYKIVLKVKDKVAQKDYAQEMTFEVKK